MEVVVMAENLSAKNYPKIVAKAWQDASFKKRLLQNPQDALKDMGIAFPQGTQVKVLESTKDVQYILLPPQPVGAITEEDLTMSGGWGTGGCY